ncbi:DUF6350 family protein [Leucobacter sp. wl10]|uniref:cell division protein PerM n=1 Tax=Leucobacter sp. wl10 TaxID=2304677 RepID=UPI000E5B2E59|nr:DUF6350 family protein [Leucobacter sp. wl10]RGE24305.1 hypothetical protein D1J51_00770 [Leucobacter sp. wl10]
MTAAIAAIEAAAAALAGLVAVAIPVLLLWVVTFDLAAEPEVVLASIGGVWLLAHWVPLSFALSPETALALGQAPEGLSFTLSLAPLGITLITALLAARAGRRFARRGGAGAAGVLGGTLGFGAVAFSVWAATSPSTPWPVWAVVLVPALGYGSVAAAAFAVAAAIDGQAWWAGALRRAQRGMEYLGARATAAFPARAALTLRLAAAALAVSVGVAALALAAALIVGYPQIMALTQSLQLDALGSTLLFLAQLVLLPVALIWALAWLTGAGFAVGAGSSATPFETLLGPVPTMPLFGAVPQGWGALGALAPAILVLGGVGVGLLGARRPELRRAPWSVAVAVPVVASALAGLAIAGLSALSSGSMGPERLAETGADPWRAGGLAAAELAVGLLLGVAAGKADYSRLRVALPDGVASARRRLRGGRSAETAPADDQETIPLDELRARLRASSSSAPRDTPVGDAPRSVDGEDPGVREAEDPAGRETVEIPSAEHPQRRAGESEGEAGRGDEDPRRRAAGTASAEAPDPADEESETEESETEALLRAYSWDQPDAEPRSEEDRPRRSGWRWPRGKD